MTSIIYSRSPDLILSLFSMFLLRFYVLCVCVFINVHGPKSHIMQYRCYCVNFMHFILCDV